MIDYTNLAYVLAAILFILGIKKLSSPKTARNGNAIASVGMLIAIVATLVSDGNMDYQTIAIGMIIGAIIGAFFAIKVEMTQMPQMVAIFNGFGGGASALVAAAEYFNPANPSTFNAATIAISVFVGTLTFTGSFIAFGKLQGFVSGKPIVFPGQKMMNAVIAFQSFYSVHIQSWAEIRTHIFMDWLSFRHLLGLHSPYLLAAQTCLWLFPY